MTFTLGSLQADTYSFFSPFPSSVSGAVHTNLIWRKLKYIENYMGESIGSASIDDKYYQVLYDMTIASIISAAQSLDTSAMNGVSLGDFSFGDNSEIEKAKRFFEQQAKEGLEAIRFMNYTTVVYKAF